MQSAQAAKEATVANRIKTEAQAQAKDALRDRLLGFLKASVLAKLAIDFVLKYW